jgi:DNA-binding FadR family transcriptional regulator
VATTIRRNPLTEQVVDALLARLSAGEWAVGGKLPGETPLAEQFGIGRSTMREAIKELAGRGVLDPRQGSGVFVLTTEPREDWDRLLLHEGIVAVIEARTAIETEAARLAAERRTPADLRTIRTALAAREAVSQTARSSGAGDDAYVDADTAFHRAIVAAAHNAVLLGMFDAFVPRSRAAMLDMLRLSRDVPKRRADHDDHAAIVSAILGHDGDAAASISRRHLAEIADAFR